MWQDERYATPGQYDPSYQHASGQAGYGAWQNPGGSHADSHNERRSFWSEGGGGGGGGYRGGQRDKDFQRGTPGGGGHASGGQDWVQQETWKDDSYRHRDRRGRGPPPVYKHEVLRRILNARTREDLANWVLEVKQRARGNVGNFVPAHVMTALNKMTKLPPGRSKGSPEQQRRSKARYCAAVNTLFDRAKYLLPQLNSRGIATVVHAAGALNRNDTEGLEMLVRRSLDEGVRRNFTTMGFSNMVWALGKVPAPRPCLYVLCVTACTLSCGLCGYAVW